MAPRPLRATVLAKELARQGHHVTLCAYLGTYDYSDFERQYNLKVESLGVFFNPQSYTEGKTQFVSGWKKKIISWLKKFFEFPDIVISHSVYKLLKRKKHIDLLGRLLIF